jgi:hypothetical protein
MPSQKRSHLEMTTEEVIHALFPKEMVKRLRRELFRAEGTDPQEKPKSAKRRKTTGR